MADLANSWKASTAHVGVREGRVEDDVYNFVRVYVPRSDEDASVKTT